MPVAFDHTIVHARDALESATFFSEMMGSPAPRRFGPFLAVPVEHGATFDFAQVTVGEVVHPQHSAFLVTEADFDQIYGRIRERGIEHYPEPHLSRTNEINHNNGGRGVYWCDPSGHFLEMLTVPYGGWPADSPRMPRRAIPSCRSAAAMWVIDRVLGWGCPSMIRWCCRGC